MKKIFIKIFQKQIIKLREKWRNQDMQTCSEINDALPKYELNKIHLQNAKLLSNRSELLNLLPKNAICAEIGVNEGKFSEEILDIAKPAKLFLVDAWNDVTYHNGLRDLVIKKFDTQIQNYKIELRIGLSTTELPKFPDNFFDWVYLDTAHTYEITVAELNILKHKIKLGGLICGHDYVTGWWLGWFRYGVIEAVHELCVKDGWELVYLTNETHQHRSFAIRKIR